VIFLFFARHFFTKLVGRSCLTYCGTEGNDSFRSPLEAKAIQLGKLPVSPLKGLFYRRKFEDVGIAMGQSAFSALPIVISSQTALASGGE